MPCSSVDDCFAVEHHAAAFGTHLGCDVDHVRRRVLLVLVDLGEEQRSDRRA